MPYLQFLNGSRDQEFQELNASASLVLGSGPEAHMTLKDPGVEAKHVTVYPAQGSYWLQDMGSGSTIKNMKRLTNSTEQLNDCDLFIVGGTFVKFWMEKPPAAAGDGGGADPAALKAAEAERDELKTKLAEAERQLEELSSSGSEAQAQLSAAEAERDQAKQDLEAAQTERRETQEKLDAANQELSEAKANVERLEGEVQTARDEAETKIAEAKAEAERQAEESEEALEASRAALEAVEGARSAAGHDNLAAARARSDLSAALDALALPDPLRLRLEQAIAAEIDREALRRVEGPVVPLRGLHVPGLERDLEGELRALKQHAGRVAKARELGLTELEPEELERLLEMARQ